MYPTFNAKREGDLVEVDDIGTGSANPNVA